MRKRTLLAVSGTAIALALGVAIAHEADHPAVKARTSIMQLYANNLGPLGAMAKGDMAYDADAASKAANNLALLVQLDQSRLWPQGTDADSISGTRALPAIWQNFPDVAEKGQALAQAVNAMQAAAGADLEALRGAMGAIGKACGDCHETYRAPDQ